MRLAIHWLLLPLLLAGTVVTSADNTATVTPVGPAASTNSAAAADAPAAPTTPSSSENGGTSGRRFGRRGGQFLERLKTQYPKEVAEIEALRATDPEAAGTKMRELMSKAGFGRGGMPPGGMMNRERETESEEAILAKLKEKLPEEFAAYEELKKTDPEKAAVKLRELLEKAGLKLPETEATAQSTLRDRNRRLLEQVNRELKERFPQRYSQLEQLREDDPDAARREFRQMVADAGIHIDLTPGKLQYEYNTANSTNANNTTPVSRNSSGSRSRSGRRSGTNDSNNSNGDMPMPPFGGGGGPPPDMMGGR